MKKKYIVILIMIIVIIAVTSSTLILINKNKKDKYDAIKYGKAEFVTSMKDINKDLPTIILFKSAMVKKSFYAERNLKFLHDDYGNQFNIVHANSDSLDNQEAIDLAKKYDIVGVPTLVALDRNGKLIEKKEDVFSKEGIEKILQDMGVNFNEKQ